MKSTTPTGHTFAQVPKAEIPRSSFNRSHGLKTTFDAGYLVPVFWDEVLPGDTFNLKMHAFARMATQLKPVMDNMFLDSFFFFVPWRIIWDNFKKFMGEQANPADSVAFNIPQMTGPAGNGILSGSLSDYFGLPVGKASVVFNSFLHRSYNLIWNSWFRDENMQNSVTVDTGDGPDTYTNYVLLKRGKRHDYFTSALPWPQKFAAISIPLGTSATVKASASQLLTGAQQAVTLRKSSDGSTLSNNVGLSSGGASGIENSGTALTGTGPAYISNLYADLNGATAATINSLRQAFQLQKLLERDARGGTRYPELLMAHFGVTDPQHYVLERPVYLGGGSTPINVNPVAGTNQVGTGATAAGNLTGMATASASGHGFTKSFTEHGFIIGLVSVRADLTYQQGLDRMFSRRTRYDTYFPSLCMIGEQSILNQEIYCNMDANDALVFGYQERYAEYRYKPSKITGLFRSNVSAGSTSIDLWHLAQNFTALPTLGDTFIKETPPVSRVVAVTTEPQFLFDSYFDLTCARPMPVYGVPGLIDHF